MINQLINRFKPTTIIISAGVLILGLTLANIYAGDHIFGQAQELHISSQSASDSTSIQQQLNEVQTQNHQITVWLSGNNQDNQHSSFQEVVLAAAKKSGIKAITKLSSLPVGEDGNFTERYKVAISGSYTRIMRFVNKLELGIIPVRITQLTIERQKENSLSCDLTIGILKTGAQSN